MVYGSNTPKTFVHDANGNMTRGWDFSNPANPFQRTSHTEYDTLGRPVSVTDKEGNITTFKYDALSRQTSMTDALGATVKYSYDLRGNLLSLEDGEGNLTQFQYDRNNRLVKEIRPMGQETSYAYDARGNLLEKIDAKNQKIAYTYNDADRLVQVRYFEASDGENAVKTVSFTYDSQGNLLTYDDGVTTGTYAYDDLYRKTGATVDYGLFAKDFSYTYYKNGLKETYTGPDEVAYTYTYDDANQWVSVDIPGQGSITNNVFHWTRPTSTTYPGGAVRNYSYDALMQMKSIEASDPAQNTVMEYHYGRDLEGNITAKGTEHGAYSYAYDDLYQLTSVDNPAIADEGYTYDDVGNRLTELGGAQDYLINANNELVSYGDVTYTYDDNGNTETTTNGTDVTNYFYDVENRLIRVEEGDGTVVAQYYYDPFGRRLWKEVGGTRTCYFYTDEGLAAEFTASGALIKSYGYRPNSTWTTNPLFMVQDSEYYYYQTDHLGTPQKLISSNGAVVWSAVYHAFGKAEVAAESTVVNNLRFAGQYFDAETGFHYNWNRYYDPQTGRYLRTDPIGFDGGINLYVYSYNNVINVVDPEGETGLLGLVAAAIGVAAIAYAIWKFYSAVDESCDLAKEHQEIMDELYDELAGDIDTKKMQELLDRADELDPEFLEAAKKAAISGQDLVYGKVGKKMPKMPAKIPGS
ncbi:MAG: RHS domain-containing protein [Desulfatibacillum sp.]|nr:RHS domain-containing protein [Desulfatibacillum sp.]